VVAGMDRIGVCGAGAMGAGIAQVAAQAGHAVVLYDVSDGAIARGQAMLRAAMAGLVKRGKLSDRDADALAGRILFTTDIEALRPAAVVIEAVVEDPGVKAQLFERLEGLVAADAILATNTSSLLIGGLAAGLKTPGRFIGMHFFNPAAVMALVEVVVARSTSDDTAARIVALARAWGKRPVRVRDVPGFIVNRIARPYYAEGLRAWSEGVGTAPQIDAAFRAVGFRMGPLELADLIGHDVNFAVARSVHDAYFGQTRFRPQPAQAALVAAGRLGRKAGAGVYDHPGQAVSDPTPASPAGAIDPDAADTLERLERDEIVHRGDVVIQAADGRSAAQHSSRMSAPCALIDWRGTAGPIVVFAASDPAAAETAAALVRDAGRTGLQLDDRPGGLVLRTLLQLANAAGDAIRDQVASAQDIDEALIHGANYPVGPWTWVQSFGFRRAVLALDHIAEETGEAMYRPSEALRRAAWRETAA